MTESPNQGFLSLGPFLQPNVALGLASEGLHETPKLYVPTLLARACVSCQELSNFILSGTVPVCFNCSPVNFVKIAFSISFLSQKNSGLHKT